jgi:hypothetical protein
MLYQGADAVSSHLHCGLKVFAGHTATAVTGHEFNPDWDFASIYYALAFKTPNDIYFG